MKDYRLRLLLLAIIVKYDPILAICCYSGIDQANARFYCAELVAMQNCFGQGV